MGLAGTGPADQHGVALLGDEAAAGEVVDERFVDRRALELEVVEVLGERQLSDGELVLDRARLLLVDLGVEQITDNALGFVLAFDGRGHDLVESGLPGQAGLVASLARPGGNTTGTNFFTLELVAKRLEFLRELVPRAVRVAVLVNPANAGNADATVRDVEAAARAMGLQIQIFQVGTSGEIHAAFDRLARERPDALFIGGDPFFTVRRVQLATLTARHGLPASSASRDFVEVGGLMSYGTNIRDAYRQVGVYAGRVLKGEKPSDLPVLQSTKFQLVINLPSAKALGLDVPPMLLARADEVIE
jgi:ABC transporter substrate binding protein